MQVIISSAETWMEGSQRAWELAHSAHSVGDAAERSGHHRTAAGAYAVAGALVVVGGIIGCVAIAKQGNEHKRPQLTVDEYIAVTRSLAADHRPSNGPAPTTPQ